MAPIRRYLRISKYSVLECRIYLSNPALAQSWLLNPRNPVLPRVIESVRPLVLPKLREERERSRNKRSARKKGIKDVVEEDDFEVSIFLTETNTRHSLLTKHKHFHDTTQTKLTSNSGRLMGATDEAPIDVDRVADAEPPVALRHEEDSDDEGGGVALAEIPAVTSAPAAEDPAATGRPKRPRRSTADSMAERNEMGDGYSADSDDDLFLADGSGSAASDVDADAAAGTGGPPPAKKRKGRPAGHNGGDGEDKKKLAMDISYEGFSIYGRVLCLVITRRDGRGAAGARPGSGAAVGSAAGKGKAGGEGSVRTGDGGAGQAIMENWISSTQVPAGVEAPP